MSPVGIDIQRFLWLYAVVWSHPHVELVFDFKWRRDVKVQQDLSGVVQVLCVPELAQLVIDNLDLRSINSLRLTCKHFRDMFAAVAPRRLRHILRRILPVKSDADIISDFADLIRQTGSLVGGSVPLAVLCPGDWEPADIDLVVDDRHAFHVEDWITSRGQFIIDETRTVAHNNDWYPSMADMDYRFTFEYKHFTSLRPEAPGLDLCILRSSGSGSDFQPAVLANWILTYHCTAVMNFWDGKHIYCLWPQLTFDKLLLRNTHSPLTHTHKAEKAFQKYKQRGFTDKYCPASFGVVWPLDYESVLLPGDSHKLICDVYPEFSALKIGAVPDPKWREPCNLVGMDELASGLQGFNI